MERYRINRQTRVGEEPQISESLDKENKLRETKKLLEKSKKFLHDLDMKLGGVKEDTERKQLIKKLEKEANGLNELGLLVKMPFISLTDLSSLSLILRDSFRTFLAYQERSVKLLTHLLKKLRIRDLLFN